MDEFSGRFSPAEGIGFSGRLPKGKLGDPANQGIAGENSDRWPKRGARKSGLP